MYTYEQVKGLIADRALKTGKNKGCAHVGRVANSANELYVPMPDGAVRAVSHGRTMVEWTPDGAIEMVYDPSGYQYPSSTEFIHAALRNNPYNISVHGISQPVMNMEGKKVLAYQGMKFTADGRMLTPLRPFLGVRVDKAKTKEMRAKLEPFMNMFVLGFESPRGKTLRSYLSDAQIADRIDDEDHWESIQDWMYSRGLETWRRSYWNNPDNYDPRIDQPKEYKKFLMKALTEHEQYTSETFYA